MPFEPSVEGIAINVEFSSHRLTEYDESTQALSLPTSDLLVKYSYSLRDDSTFALVLPLCLALAHPDPANLMLQQSYGPRESIEGNETDAISEGSNLSDSLWSPKNIDRSATSLKYHPGSLFSPSSSEGVACPATLGALLKAQLARTSFSTMTLINDPVMGFKAKARKDAASSTDALAVENDVSVVLLAPVPKWWSKSIPAAWFHLKAELLHVTNNIETQQQHPISAGAGGEWWTHIVDHDMAAISSSSGDHDSNETSSSQQSGATQRPSGLSFAPALDFGPNATQLLHIVASFQWGGAGTASPDEVVTETGPALSNSTFTGNGDGEGNGFSSTLASARRLTPATASNEEYQSMEASASVKPLHSWADFQHGDVIRSEAVSHSHRMNFPVETTKQQHHSHKEGQKSSTPRKIKIKSSLRAKGDQEVTSRRPLSWVPSLKDVSGAFRAWVERAVSHWMPRGGTGNIDDSSHPFRPSASSHSKQWEKRWARFQSKHQSPQSMEAQKGHPEMLHKGSGPRIDGGIGDQMSRRRLEGDTYAQSLIRVNRMYNKVNSRTLCAHAAIAPMHLLGRFTRIRCRRCSGPKRGRSPRTCHT